MDVEHWICNENIARFQLALLEERDEVKRIQLADLLSQELRKLHKMVPD